MKVLVISGCSANKHYSDGVGGESLDRQSHEELLEQEPASRRLPAREMYTGNGHEHVAAAVDRLQALEDVEVDWQIISAGFGTLDAETPIVPYDCTLSRSSHTKADYRARADRLDIADEGQTIDELIQDIGRAKDIADTILAGDLAQYDAIFTMLGREYLLAAADVYVNLGVNVTLRFLGGLATRNGRRRA